MALRNRVTPLGELVATPARGLVYGNRGCLHDARGEVRRAFVGRRWIACRLEFRGRHRHPIVQPGRYTALFFLDEATALAAGHRPCAECRRADYERFTAFWREPYPADVGADAIDLRLHGERLVAGTRERRLHESALAGLPDGSFVLLEGVPHLVLGDALLPYSPAGYGPPRPRAGGPPVVTPPSLVALLASGWEPGVPLLHPTAGVSAA
jgi:hypothetical protein